MVFLVTQKDLDRHMINALSSWISPAAISGRLEPGPKRFTPAQNTAQRGERKKERNKEMREEKMWRSEAGGIWSELTYDGFHRENVRGESEEHIYNM